MAISVIDGTGIPADARLADLIWQTDPQIFDLIFGDPALWQGLFPAEWAAPFGNHPACDTRVAMEGTRPAGLVISFPGQEVAARFAATLARFLGAATPAAAHRITSAFAAMEWLFPQVPGHALYILNIVVAPDCRQGGIGRLLVDEAARKARATGLTEIHLDTAADNPATGFYRRLGFRPLVESRALNLPDALPAPLHLRFMLPLT